jgi:hypothetical protein
MRGWVSKNQISDSTPARLFCLTALAISIAPRPFKFRKISVSISTRTFVFSIHSLAFRTMPRKRTQLGIPFRATKNGNKLSECHCVKEKPSQNNTRQPNISVIVYIVLKESVHCLKEPIIPYVLFALTI